MSARKNVLHSAGMRDAEVEHEAQHRVEHRGVGLRPGARCCAMNRASARSKSLTSTPRRRLATCSTACTTASASRRLTPAMSSRSAACCTGSRRPAAPKSMSASCPSAQQHHVARMRVGVEHAFLQHLLEERAQQRVGQLHPVGDRARRSSRPRARSRRRATPSRARATCSGPRTRSAREMSRRRSGMVEAMAAALRASIR